MAIKRCEERKWWREQSGGEKKEDPELLCWAFWFICVFSPPSFPKFCIKSQSVFLPRFCSPFTQLSMHPYISISLFCARLLFFFPPEAFALFMLWVLPHQSVQHTLCQLTLRLTLPSWLQPNPCSILRERRAGICFHYTSVKHCCVSNIYKERPWRDTVCSSISPHCHQSGTKSSLVVACNRSLTLKLQVRTRNYSKFSCQTGAGAVQ